MPEIVLAEEENLSKPTNLEKSDKGRRHTLKKS